MGDKTMGDPRVGDLVGEPGGAPTADLEFGEVRGREARAILQKGAAKVSMTSRSSLFIRGE
jgi:hypothetical protein